MNVMADYFKERDERNYRLMDSMTDEMPNYVREFLISVQNRTSVLTRLNYVRDIKTFLTFLSESLYGAKPIAEVTLQEIDTVTAYDIELFLDYLTHYAVNGKKHSCQNSAKARKLAAMRSLFKFLYARDKIKENVTLKVEMPKKLEKPIVYLEADETSRLLDEVETASALSSRQRAFHKSSEKRDIALVTLLLGTGIRISECIGLNHSDFDFNNNAFSVTRKGGNRAMLYFSDEVKAALLDYIDWKNTQIELNTPFALRISDKQAFFLSNRGERMGVRAAELLVKKYAKIVVPLKKISPHKLRSTYGTALYRETGDIYVVADVLGHKDVNTTKKHYASISETARRAVADKVQLRDKDKK